MGVVENTTFDEIRIGQSAELRRTLTGDDIRLFGVLSGDANPTHYGEYESCSLRHRAVGHGMWGAALISALLGNELPGAGTVYKKQNIDFMMPVEIGDTLTVTITVTGLNPADKTVSFDCKAVNQHGQTAFTGLAVVVAPTEKKSEERTGALYAQF